MRDSLLTYSRSMTSHAAKGAAKWDGKEQSVSRVLSVMGLANLKVRGWQEP